MSNVAQKYELTSTTHPNNPKLRQIRALRNIPRFGVKAGDLGGWIEKEGNLSQEGNAWVYGNARVYGNAEVYGDADISGRRHVLWLTPVGSENGTLTAYRTKNNGVEVIRGCFSGTLAEFEAAAANTHGNNEYGEEYSAVIALLKVRFAEVLEGEAA